MLSFIVIGRNLSKTIVICISSIFSYIRINNIKDYEIIYVDSDSSDDTIEKASRFPVSIIKITGNPNAAVGRNIGFKYSKGEILFFIDGDMELLPEAYKDIFDKKTNKLNYPYSTGLLKQIIYDENFNYYKNDDEKMVPVSIYKSATGGFNIILRSLREKAGEMDERLVRNQDLDFSLRLTGIGYPVLKYNTFVATHHTIDYHNTARIRSFLFGKNLLYQGLLMRKHIFNLKYLGLYKRNCMYVLFVGFVIASFFINLYLFSALFLIYLIMTSIRVFKREVSGIKDFYFSFFLRFFNPVYTLIGLFFFFPGKPKYSLEFIFVSKCSDEDGN
jgi:glycosyltransferase involved in cell wall biosynthesis